MTKHSEREAGEVVLLVFLAGVTYIMALIYDVIMTGGEGVMIARQSLLTIDYAFIERWKLIWLLLQYTPMFVDVETSILSM